MHLNYDCVQVTCEEDTTTLPLVSTTICALMGWPLPVEDGVIM